MRDLDRQCRRRPDQWILGNLAAGRAPKARRRDPQIGQAERLIVLQRARWQRGEEAMASRASIVDQALPDEIAATIEAGGVVAYADEASFAPPLGGSEIRPPAQCASGSVRAARLIGKLGRALARKGRQRRRAALGGKAQAARRRGSASRRNEASGAIGAAGHGVGKRAREAASGDEGPRGPSGRRLRAKTPAPATLADAAATVGNDRGSAGGPQRGRRGTPREALAAPL